MTTRLPIGAVGLAALLVLSLAPAQARAEEGPRMIPVLGMHVTPSMSVVLPVGSAGAVTETYGLVHPAGSLGLSVHLNETFSFVVDVEAEGWVGALELPDADPIDMRFLSYWVHVRTRTRFARVGPVSFLVDAGVGLIFSREDAHLFRAEGSGFSLFAGPLVEVSLGRWISLSLGVLFEPGWVYFDVRTQGESRYTIAWPRVLFGLGVDGWVIHRPARVRRAAQPEAAPEPEAEAEPAPGPEAEPPPEPEAEPAPEPPPPPPRTGLEGVESPFDE